MKLYTYWRSSAAYRVRIVLELKELKYESVPVHLVRDGGEHIMPHYESVNPQKLVPALELDSGLVVNQSMAIMEYLEEAFPDPQLLPGSAGDRAWVRSFCMAVACEIHPLNNLRVLKYLQQEMNVDDAQKTKWYAHWVKTGFASMEKMLASHSSRSHFCFGEHPTIADACLVPQVYNARRFNIDLSAFPEIVRIDQNCRELEAFSKARPETQEDAE